MDDIAFADILRWGRFPFWAKDASIGPRYCSNAMSEILTYDRRRGAAGGSGAGDDPQYRVTTGAVALSRGCEYGPCREGRRESGSQRTRCWREMDSNFPFRRAIRLRFRNFTLALRWSPPTSGRRSVEELLAGRALDISYETEGRWVLNLGSRRSALPR